MTVLKATVVGPRVLGRPLGLGCQSSSGRETPGESPVVQGITCEMQLADLSP